MGAEAICSAFRALAPLHLLCSHESFSLDPNYAPVLSDEELYLMGVSSSQDLCYYVLCVVREPVGESTVNLKCPIVIHAEEKKAVQVILDTGTYHMRHRLSEFRSEEAGSVC